jgi:hypothetical protein
MKMLSREMMVNYGYTYTGMLPVSEFEAAQLFAANNEVFLLYPDDTEAVAESLDDILKHAEYGGMFGVEA